MRSTPAPVLYVSPVHAQKSTEDGLTEDPGGWAVTNHFYPSFLQMRCTPAPVIDVSSTHAQKSTEDGLTRIQGGGWLVITFTIHFCRLAAVAHLSTMFC